MAEYPIGIRDEASSVAGKIRKNVSALREEMRAVGEVRMQSGTKLSTLLKATALQGAARWGSEKIAQVAVLATSRANRQAARSADVRAHAERRAGTAVLRSVRAERELARLRGHGHGRAAAGLGGAGRGGAGDGLGGGGYAPTRGRDPWMTGLAVAGGGLAAAGLGIGAFMGARAAIGGLAMVATSAIGVMRGLASTLVSAAKAAGVLAFEFGKATVAAFDFRSRAVTAFQALVKDGEGGFNRLKETALEMRMSLGDTFEGMRAMLAAGFKESDATRLFKRLQDLKGIGITQEVLGRVTLAIAQIKGAGQLQGDELRQLMETGLDIELVWKSISKQMGVSIEKAKKLKEQGKVSAKVAIQAIEDAIKQKTGGRAAGALGQEMAKKTFEGFRSTMGLARGLIFTKIAGGAAGEGITTLLESMNTAADSFFGWLESKDAGAFFDEISSAIKDIALAAKDVVDSPFMKEIGLAAKGVALDIKDAFTSPFAKQLAADLKDVAVAVFRIGEAAWGLAKAFGSGFAGKGAMELQGWKDNLASINKSMRSEAAKEFFRDVGAFARKAADAIAEFAWWWEETARGDLEAVGSLNHVANRSGSSFGQGLVSGAVAGLKGLIPQILLSMAGLDPQLYEAGARAARSLVDGIINGILAGLPRIQGVTTTMGDAVKSALKGEWDSHSPSRDFEKIAGTATAGTAKGLAANDNARTAAANMGREVKRAAIEGMRGPVASEGVSSFLAHGSAANDRIPLFAAREAAAAVGAAGRDARGAAAASGQLSVSPVPVDTDGLRRMIATQSAGGGAPPGAGAVTYNYVTNHTTIPITVQNADQQGIEDLEAMLLDVFDRQAS